MGLVDGLCLAQKCGISEWMKLDKDLVSSHDQIVHEIKQLWKSGYRGIKQIDLCQIQRLSFPDQQGWTPIWIKLGDVYAQSASQLPTLKRIIERYQNDVLLCFVSVMMPGTKLKPHIGPNMSAVRYHYPLVVPQGNARLLISGMADDSNNNNHNCDATAHLMEWQERKGFIWDDTIEHAAWNLTNEIRVVLFIDLLRSRMPWHIQIMSRLSMWALERSKYIKGMQEKLLNDGIQVDHHF